MGPCLDMSNRLLVRVQIFRSVLGHGGSVGHGCVGIWYELKLALTQSHMTQKLVLRGEVGARTWSESIQA